MGVIPPAQMDISSTLGKRTHGVKMPPEWRSLSALPGLRLLFTPVNSLTKIQCNVFWHQRRTISTGDSAQRGASLRAALANLKQKEGSLIQWGLSHGMQRKTSWFRSFRILLPLHGTQRMMPQFRPFLTSLLLNGTPRLTRS